MTNQFHDILAVIYYSIEFFSFCCCALFLFASRAWFPVHYIDIYFMWIDLLKWNSVKNLCKEYYAKSANQIHKMIQYSIYNPIRHWNGYLWYVDQILLRKIPVKMLSKQKYAIVNVKRKVPKYIYMNRNLRWEWLDNAINIWTYWTG